MQRHSPVKRPQKRAKPKRKTALASLRPSDHSKLAALAKRVRYRESPYHKSRIGRDKRTIAPRPDKTDCSVMLDAGSDARKLLRAGLRTGMVSEQRRGAWPQNVWALDGRGIVYEAQLSNRTAGEYHGYPMKIGDAFAEYIAAQWRMRQETLRK